MKKIFKIIIILLIIFNLYSVTCMVNAVDIWQTGKNFLDKGASGNTNIDAATAKAGIEELVDFLWGIGLLVIFVGTVILGIRYMLVLPNERSRIKQATTPYIIGVIIIFGALTIWKLLINVLDSTLR